MNEATGNMNTTDKVQVSLRPVLLTMLCLFSFIYFALLAVLFFTGIFFSGSITAIRNLYVPEDTYSKTQLLFFFIAGFLLHMASFSGTLLIWFNKRIGYLIVTIACFIIAICQIIQPQASIGITPVYFSLIILFGLFYKKIF